MNHARLVGGSGGSLFFVALGSAVLLLLSMLSIAWVLTWKNSRIVERAEKMKATSGDAAEETETEAEKEKKVKTPTDGAGEADSEAFDGATDSIHNNALSLVEHADESVPETNSCTVTTAIAATTAATIASNPTEISKRVVEAKQTLSSIHAELPDGMAPAEKYAMTQMMLEAIKVNESCKAASSMQRMEHIAEQGNEIQSELRTIEEKKMKSADVARRALALQRTAMDALCVGVVAMLCSATAVTLYGRSSSHRTFMGTVHVRNIRTVAVSSCGGANGEGYPSVPVVLFVPVIGQLVCYATHTLRLVQAAVLLVLTPVVISKLGMFQLGGDVPVFKLVTTCGLICGASGTYAVDWLGGRGGLWLGLWEMFVGIVTVVILSAKRIVASSRYRCSDATLFLVSVVGCSLIGAVPFLHFEFF